MREKCAERDGVAAWAILDGYNRGWNHWTLFCPLRPPYANAAVAKLCEQPEELCSDSPLEVE